MGMDVKSDHGFDAVIFDLDGTIVDSEPLHEQTFYQLFEELGHRDDHGIRFEEYLGTSDEAVWRDFLVRFPQPQGIGELLLLKQQRYLEVAASVRPVFPGVCDLVRSLAEHYQLGLASGSRHEVINAMLSMADMDPHFPAHVRVSSQDVPQGKPDPRIFLRAAELLGVDPSRCCVIEDSVFGVTAANRAGMKSIAITNTFPGGKLTHAWKVVSDYQSIRTILLKSA